jgi:hypothetical protein
MQRTVNQPHYRAIPYQDYKWNRALSFHCDESGSLDVLHETHDALRRYSVCESE